jgi:predicted  nucleic acid-binding Zn ribbon protein
MFKYQKSSFVHWMAIVSIAMASLAPAVSQAMAEQGFKVEVCTVMGTKMVSMADDANTKQDANQKSCPYCLAHTAYAMPVNTTLNLEQPKLLSLHPQLFYKSPKPLTAWVTPPNQAPPQLA